MTWWKRAHQAGHRTAAKELAYLLESAGRKTEALEQWRRTPGRSAVRRIADEMLRDGRDEDAITWLLEHATSSNPIHLANLLLQHSRTDEAITVLRNATDNWDPDSGLYRGMLRRTARLMTDRGRIDDAVAWLRHRADLGYHEAVWEGTNLLVAEGRADEAIAWLKEIPAEFARAAELLVEQGRSEEALGWLQDRADHRMAVTDLLRQSGRTEELLALYLRAAESGDPHAAGTLAELLEAEGRIDEAVTWLRRTGRTDIPERVAEMLSRAGRTGEAVTWWQRVANTGASHALWQVASLLGARDGEQLRRYGWEPDGGLALPWSLRPTP